MTTSATYVQDITGEIKQWDERDIVFARKDLHVRFGAESAEYQSYYAGQPGHLEYDARVAKMPGLGRRGGDDAAMFEVQFESIRRLAAESAVVTTDMPLAHDRPVDIGVQSFCARCKICAEERPIGAIPSGDKVESNGVRKWKLDEEKCYRYWHATGTDCGLCMASCPWTHERTLFHRGVARLACVAGPHQTLLTQAHKLVYGRCKSASPPAFLEHPKS